MSEYLVFTTTSRLIDAKKIARVLVLEKLAACINIQTGITSYYVWEGSLNQDKEVRLIIKTKKSLLRKIKTRIKKIHPYKTPAIYSLEISDIDKDYKKWVQKNLKS